METARPHRPTPPTEPPIETPPGERPELAAGNGLDAALSRREWACVLALWREGVADAGFLRLLRLRTAYRSHAAPATDGLERDPRARFARWLVAQGRLNEGV